MNTKQLLVDINRSVFSLNPDGDVGEYDGDIVVFRNEMMTWDEVKQFVGHDLEEAEFGKYRGEGYEHEHSRATLSCKNAQEAFDLVKTHGGRAVFAKYTVRLYKAVPASPVSV